MLTRILSAISYINRNKKHNIYKLHIVKKETLETK